MPRDTFDIRQFATGIISKVDPQDIPPDAESWSDNVDVDLSPGYLRGRITDAPFQATSPTKGLNAPMMAEIERVTDNVFDLITYKSDTGAFQRIPDYLAASPGSIDTSLGSTTVAIEPCCQRHNQTLHIGCGDAEAKWIGVIETGQLDATPSTSVQGQDAALHPPRYFPKLYKTFYSGGYIYGIQWKGEILWKIRASDGVIISERRSYVSTQGLCKFDDTYCYLYDKVGDLGMIHKIRLSDFTSMTKTSVEGFGTVANNKPINNGDGEISDIECSTTNLWMAAWGTKFMIGGTPGYITSAANQEFIFRVTISSLTDGVSVLIPCCTPTRECNAAGDNHAGTFHDGTNPTATYRMMGKRQLIRSHNANEILLLTSSSNEVFYKDTNFVAEPGVFLVVMNDSTADGAKLNSTNCHLAELFPPPTSGYIDGVDVPIQGNIAVGYWRGLLLVDGGTNVIDTYAIQDVEFWSMTATAWDADDGWVVLVPTSSIPKNATGVTDVGICNLDGGYIGIFDLIYASGGRYYRQAYSPVNDTIGAIGYLGQPQVSLTLALLDSPVGTLDAHQYFYNLSFIYDGFQESPLIQDMDMSTWSITGEALHSCQITLGLFSLPARVTGINIYRAENASVTGTTPTSFYRLVTTVPVDHGWYFNVAGATGWGTPHTRVFQDTGIIGPSYETNTGISETLPSNNLNYSYSTSGMGYHFVGDVSSQDIILGGDRMVVRSKQNAYDMFDWSVDFLYMPKEITAMQFFAGSLFVFAADEFYRINPAGMFFEDTISGYGCINKYSVTAIEGVGMFFADRNGFYAFDGKAVKPIGERAKTSLQSYAEPWIDTTSATYTIRVVPFLKYQSILFMQCPPLGTAVTRVYVYHLPDGAIRYWDITAAGSASKYGAFMDHTGQAWFSHIGNLVKICGDATLVNTVLIPVRKAWDWYSPHLDFGDSGQEKILYKLTQDGDATLTYLPDAETSWVASSVLKSRFKRIIVKAVGTAGTEIVRAISLMYRRLEGKR